MLYLVLLQYAEEKYICLVQWISGVLLLFCHG